MIYLDIIMTDKENCNEITPILDHRAMLLKDVIKKPKLSLWDLYKLKKHIETAYERLTDETNEENAKVSGGVEVDGEEMGGSGDDSDGSPGETEADVGSDKGEGSADSPQGDEEARTSVQHGEDEEDSVKQDSTDAAS